MKKQILVTGGVGYIGSHTVVELINAGNEVVIVDNLSNSKIEMLDGIKSITNTEIPYEQFDLCDAEKVDALFKKYDFSTIIHFAAFKAVGESVNEPLKYYRNNTSSLINLLEASAKYSVPNFVFSSSCTVYGQPEVLPVTETSPIQEAMSPYGNTKQVCEEIIRDFVATDDTINAIVLRYFNPVGAHRSSSIGELPIGVPQNLIPFITQTAAGLREKLMVFGDDYNTPDGSCIRDYIDVVDLAKAHVVAGDRLLNKVNKSNFEIFNLGTGNGLSVIEILKSFEKVSGQKLNYEIAPRRSGDIEQIWADASFANNELGWKAESHIDDTLLSAWNWEKKYRGI